MGRMTGEAFIAALIDAGVITDPMEDIRCVVIRCDPSYPVSIEVERWTKDAPEILRLMTSDTGS